MLANVGAAAGLVLGVAGLAICVGIFLGVVLKIIDIIVGI